MSDQPHVQELRADYTGPQSASKAFKLAVKPIPGEGDVAAKTVFLSTLRSQLGQLQSDVNTFLTEQMEADKIRQTRSDDDNNRKGKAVIDEDREEDMYGEEEQ